MTRDVMRTATAPHTSAPAAMAAEAPPAIVSVAPAVRTDFAPRHWAPGSIISRRDARVASELEGRVLQVAEVGQRVRAGQALAVLDDTALRLRARESEAELARIRAQLDLAVRQEQRYAQLAAQQNIARSQYEQLRAERERNTSRNVFRRIAKSHALQFVPRS